MGSVSDVVRDHCALLGISISDLAKLTGQSTSNLFNKLRRDNWTIQQLQQIADVTDSELKVLILPKMGRRRSSSFTLDGPIDKPKNWNK